MEERRTRNGEHAMKYMLLINVPRGTEAFQSDAWSAKDIETHMRYLAQLNGELERAGELAGLEALAPPVKARIVRAGDNGAPVVTDGPFPEAKEFLAGYWIVEVPSAQRAYDIAAKGSAAPGPGGEPLMMPIEVREIVGAPPVSD
jgi:hypothetical protein